MKVNTGFKVSLEKVVQELQFEVIYEPSPLKDIFLTSSNVNRPGI